MCGVCGSTPARHWSAPFLATLPARSSAARAATAIATRAGTRVGVAAVAGGYAVTTSTGQCSIAADLGEVGIRLRRLPALDRAVPPAPPRDMASAGPATVPPAVAGPLTGAAARRTTHHRPARTAPSPWLYRLPAILCWLAVVDGRGPRGLRLRLGLNAQIDVAIDVVGGTVVRCAAVDAGGATDGEAELDDPTGSFAEPLGVLLDQSTAHPIGDGRTGFMTGHRCPTVS